MPESQVRPAHNNQRALVYERQSFWEATVDNFVNPPGQDPDHFDTLENVEPVTDNTLTRRRGYELLANPVCAARRMFDAHFASGANRIILTASDGSGTSSLQNQVTSINEDGARGHASNNILTPAATASQPHVAVSRQYAYICDGVSGDLKKWNGVDDPATAEAVTDWGFKDTSPASAFTAASSGAGSIILETGRTYAVAFLNTTTSHADLATNSDGTVMYSAVGVLTAEDVALSTVPVFGVTGTGYATGSFHRVILATADGGPLDTLYEVGRITDNTTTTFADSVAEDTLLASAVWAQLDSGGLQIGVYDNTSPATSVSTLSIVIPHRGRLFGISEQFLFWSKNLGEVITSTNTVTGRFEECWPATYQMPIAIQSEFGRALLSDGINLYIGTDRGIIALSGDYPYFNGPRTIFHEVGVLRQDVWKTVYHEGQQVGTIWLTPDKRVIGSDFNTYVDIGQPIQTTLNAMDVSAAASVANATFVSDGRFELYLLAIPAPGVSTTIESGTAQAGGASTITLAAGESAINDYYNGYTIEITGGLGSGQTRTISDYNGTSKVATVSAAWTTQPDNTSTYEIYSVECDTLCVYDVIRKRWFIWKPTETDTAAASPGFGILAQCFLQDVTNRRTEWLFSTKNGSPIDGRVYRWFTTATELATANDLRDRNTDGETPVTYAVTIKTVWLDWNLAQVSKFLNSLELMTNDTALTVTIEGASTQADFDSPITVLSATAVTANPFGQYSVGVAALETHYRFYRFTFTSPAGTTRELLNYLAIEAVPLHPF